MNIRSNLFFSRPRVGALALAASLLSVGATSANAQWFRWSNWDNALSPMQVERMVQASGYRLTGPVMRNGPVYLANVLGREDDRERLVIDAWDGRLLQRYGAGARRQPAVSGDWPSPPRQQAALSDGWLDREDDSPPPRPPANVYGDAEGGLLHGPQAAPKVDARPGSQLSRADDSSNPYVILAPPAAAHAPALEKPRPKPQVRRKKPDQTPIAQPAAAPVDGKPAPVAQPAANPPALTNPQAAIAPNVAKPTQPDAVGEPAAAAPRVADTKAVAAPAPEIAPAAPVAPPPKAVKPKPALNDVPVAPLE